MPDGGVPISLCSIKSAAWLQVGTCAAANTASDNSQLGTVQVPDGPWVDELPKAWRTHMNTQLKELGSKGSFRLRAAGKAGLWATAAPKTVPLDQGSVNGVMQNVHEESVRKQVCNSTCHLCLQHCLELGIFSLSAVVLPHGCHSRL